MSAAGAPAGDDDAATGRVLVALADLGEALDAARAQLVSAEDVDWVSSAADAYRRRLEDAVGDVARLRHALGAAYPAVVRHLRAADEARIAALSAPSELSVALGLPAGVRGLADPASQQWLTDRTPPAPAHGRPFSADRR